MVDSALALAAISTEDPFAGLPDASELGALAGDLELYSDDIDHFDTTARIQAAMEAEEAALRRDPRITNSEGASFNARIPDARFRQFAWISGRLSRPAVVR